MNPTLSIIVPVYKVEAYLHACIDSITGQPFGDFELILVDDGSPDRCGAICDEYAAQDSRIRVIHQPNGGLSSARNTGINIARGAYLTFVDSDDTVSADTYPQNMSTLLSDPSIDLLEYPVLISYGSPEERLWKNKTQHIHGKENIFSYWIKTGGYHHAYAWNKIYKRELFENVRFPEGKTFEDIYAMPQILDRATHLYMSGQGVYYYHSRAASITRSAAYMDFYYLLEANLAVLKRIGGKTGLRKEFLIHYLYTVNILIDLLKCPDANKDTNRRMTGELKDYHVSARQLAALDIPARLKYKNYSLALLGLKAHCALYIGLFKLLK